MSTQSFNNIFSSENSIKSIKAYKYTLNSSTTMNNELVSTVENKIQKENI